MRANSAPTVVLLALVVVASVVALPTATAGSVVAQQQTNTTSTATETPAATPTETPAVCEDPSQPEMEQARLYAPDTTINTDEPGRIDGGFMLDGSMDCPTEVTVTLTVPSGMTITGGSDWESSGAGIVTTTFILNPDQGLRDLSANVYSSESGTKRVTGNIEYHPVGHDDMSREIDGLTFNFDVEEPNTPTNTEAAGGNSGDSGGSDEADTGSGALGSFLSWMSNNVGLTLAILAIIVLAYVVPKVEISN